MAVRKIEKPRELLLAFIPILFAIQQVSEGILWISTSEIEDFVHYAPICKAVYLSIALFVWPIWIPLSMWAVETQNWRNWALAGLLAIGCIFVAGFGYELVFVHRWEGVDLRIIGHSIQYILPVTFGNLYTALYCIATVVPPFLSSWRYMWVFGLLNMIGLAISEYFYEVTFVSVWCFFAAIVSMGAYFVISRNFAPVLNKLE